MIVKSGREVLARREDAHIYYADLIQAIMIGPYDPKAYFRLIANSEMDRIFQNERHAEQLTIYYRLERWGA